MPFKANANATRRDKSEHGPISVSRLATCLLLSFEIPVRSIQAGRVMPSMLLCKLSTYNRRSVQQ
jgi:hypothetical protein